MATYAIRLTTPPYLGRTPNPSPAATNSLPCSSSAGLACVRGGSPWLLFLRHPFYSFFLPPCKPCRLPATCYHYHRAATTHPACGYSMCEKPSATPTCHTQTPACPPFCRTVWPGGQGPATCQLGGGQEPACLGQGQDNLLTPGRTTATGPPCHYYPTTARRACHLPPNFLPLF